MYQCNSDRQDLSDQYNYITNKFSTELLVNHLKKALQQPGSVKQDKNTIKIYSKNKNSHIVLHIYKKHLEFYCKNLNEAEELLFPALRTYQSLLFITNNKTDDFGWISPVINNYEFKNSPKLYSYL